MATERRLFDMVLSPYVGRNGFRIEIQSDQGVSGGTFSVDAFELLTPIVLSEESFQSMQVRLSGGFTQVTREVILEQRLERDAIQDVVCRGIRSLLNVLKLESSADGSPLKFAGCYRKGMTEETVLISASTYAAMDSSTTNSVSLIVNCSDAVLCATIADFLKKNLSKCILSLSS